MIDLQTVWLLALSFAIAILTTKYMQLKENFEILWKQGKDEEEK